MYTNRVLSIRGVCQCVRDYARRDWGSLRGVEQGEEYTGFVISVCIFFLFYVVLFALSVYLIIW